MSALMRYWWVAAILLVALFFLSDANTIPRLDEQVKAQWAQVENQYQRRSDLIPNLVTVVKNYAAYEKGTLTEVINARARATEITLSPEMLEDPEAVKKFQQAQGELSSSLSRLMAISEKYPDLKADQNFLGLQSQLEGTENRIAVARRDYIGAVLQYNVHIRTFPGVIWAMIYKAKPKAEFTSDDVAQKVPEIKF